MTKLLQSVLCKTCYFQSALSFCMPIFHEAAFVQFVCKPLILLNLAQQSVLVLHVCKGNDIFKVWVFQSQECPVLATAVPA